MHFKEASSSGKLRGSVLFVLQVRVGGGFTICPAAVCPRLRGGAAEGCRGPGPGDLSQWPCDLEWGPPFPGPVPTRGWRPGVLEGALGSNSEAGC